VLPNRLVRRRDGNLPAPVDGHGVAPHLETHVAVHAGGVVIDGGEKPVERARVDVLEQRRLGVRRVDVRYFRQRMHDRRRELCRPIEVVLRVVCPRILAGLLDLRRGLRVRRVPIHDSYSRLTIEGIKSLPKLLKKT